MAMWRVDVEHAKGVAGDSVVVEAENEDDAAGAALSRFPPGWIALTVEPATDQDREVAIDLTSDGGNAPVVTQMPPEQFALHQELVSAPIVPPGASPEDG